MDRKTPLISSFINFDACSKVGTCSENNMGRRRKILEEMSYENIMFGINIHNFMFSSDNLKAMKSELGQVGFKEFIIAEKKYDWFNGKYGLVSTNKKISLLLCSMDGFVYAVKTFEKTSNVQVLCIRHFGDLTEEWVEQNIDEIYMPAFRFNRKCMVPIRPWNSCGVPQGNCYQYVDAEIYSAFVTFYDKE